MTFNLAAFLEEAEWDERSSICSPNKSSFHREMRLTPSSIFGRAAQNSQSFRRKARRPRSRFSLPGNSLERSRWPAWRAAFGNCHGHCRLYRARDRKGGDDPRDARGAFLLRYIPEIPAGP